MTQQHHDTAQATRRHNTMTQQHHDTAQATRRHNTMTQRKLPDGTIIEFTYSDTHTSPGKEGQRCGSGIWYRINAGDWKISNFRTLHQLFEWLFVCDTLEEYLECEAFQ